MSRINFLSDIAIRVENLGKRYRIGQRERYYALRDTLALTAPLCRLAVRRQPLAASRLE